MTADEAQSTPTERVRVLQRKLYRAAKAEPGRTFGILYEKVYSSDVLREAWRRVRSNRGSAGIDGQTIEAIEAEGVDKLLATLQLDLKSRRYRPSPVRRVLIPKADGRQRPLGIPRVRDRIVQAAVRIVIEPLFEASFRPVSYGFRPKRGARQAVEEIRKWVNCGWDEVIDLDLKSYFDTIDHEILIGLVRRRVRDPRVLRLIRLWLRAGVMQEGRWQESLVGTPQGGVISPLLANIYLHPLDVHWEKGMAASHMVRYADDLVVLCGRGTAEKHLVELRAFLERLKLTVNEEKTRIVAAQEGFDFLGLHFCRRAVRLKPGRRQCYVWPSRRSMQRLRDKVRATIDIDTRPSLAEKIRQLNPVVRGWGNYFSPYNSARHFRKVDYYVWCKLSRWLRRKHQSRTRVVKDSPSAMYRQAGLYTLQGSVAYAR